MDLEIVAMDAAMSTSLVTATPTSGVSRECPQDQTSAVLVVAVEPAGRSSVHGVSSNVVATVSAATAVNGSASVAAESEIQILEAPESRRVSKMSSNSDDAQNESNDQNGITKSSFDGDAFRTENYSLPDRISEFFKTWGHHGRGEVPTSSTMKPKSYEIKWRYILSKGTLYVLWVSRPILAFIRWCVELPGNVWNANGGIWQAMKRLLTFEIELPRKDSAEYHSFIAQLDPRTRLWVDRSAAGTSSGEAATSTTFPGNDAGARSTADVLVMASKLAYENEAVIKKVVTRDWNMHFEGFSNCWNEFLNQNNTQVFLFTDKPQNANAIVVAWRGTEPFNAMDWSTDFDFYWDHLEGMGNVHMGFLEALGLANRNSVQSFQHLQNKRNAKVADKRQQGTSSSGLPQDVIDDADKRLAYDHVTNRVRELLRKHPGAKVYITGHSLGGALAALYAGMLHYNKDTAITKRLAAVYTFGQPRIGDKELKYYMEAKLKEKYFRVVYCNDLVPRIPFDNQLFKFKHFGYCFYYNSRYKSKCLEEAPKKNFFYPPDLLSGHITALEEFCKAWRPVDPEFAESWFSCIVRGMAFFVPGVGPGVGGHSPVNYVNAVRLGSELTEEIHEIDQTQHDWEEKARGFVYRLYSKYFSSS